MKFCIITQKVVACSTVQGNGDKHFAIFDYSRNLSSFSFSFFWHDVAYINKCLTRSMKLRQFKAEDNIKQTYDTSAYIITRIED